MAIAEKLPDVQSELAKGKSIEEIKENPALKECAEAYYSKDKVIQVVQNPDGSYEFQDDGRHRITADLYVTLSVIRKQTMSRLNSPC